jgi:deoxyribonuclease V
MQIHALHEWNVSPAEAIALQKRWAGELNTRQPIDLNAVRLVAGVDVSVKPNPAGQDISQAAVVVMTFPALAIVDVVQKQMPTPFPYIPGLLTFREGPVLQQAFEALQHTPDAFLFDGMGIAHPRRMGIGAHLGLWLQKPTVGVGKTRLFGHYANPPDVRGEWTPLKDRAEVIGAVLRTRAHVHPVFVSPGHLIDLSSALALVMACTSRYRLPEPIRAAHKAAHL